jgi:Zn-dependent protease with chaperone function
VASLPLLVLFFQMSTLVLMPPINALSRHFERESDRFGIELNRKNQPAATAFVKLQRENLANPRPGWVYTLWRARHPSLAERIDFCNRYRPWATGEPMRYAERLRGRM